MVLRKQAPTRERIDQATPGLSATETSALQNDSERAKKTFGRVYTPKAIVDTILDLAGYRGKRIVGRHAIDNSCGDGAFLAEIVKRYCKACKNNLKENLETFVHGIEIDENERRQCVARLDAIAEKYGVYDVKWDVLCADALTVDRYDGKMDFVLGNPPYIRVHNLGGSFERVKRFEFAQDGMTDLYLVFYEIGLKMLAPRGVLGYITPSSFVNSLAGKPFRECVVKRNLLKTLVDLGHYQVFDARTYSAIAILENDRTQTTTDVYEYDGELRPLATLDKDDFSFNGAFYFASKENLALLKEIFALGANGKSFEVKNGFATLADSFFIGDSLTFKRTIPVVKASTGKWTRCLFPYENERLIPYEELAKDEALREYYEARRDALKSRSLTERDEWHGFGRSQGVKDVGKKKVAINSLIRTEADVKLTLVPKGSGVYGGLYILSRLSFDNVKKLVCTREFATYVSLLKKYKSGGYYAFSSKDLKIYLEYARAKERINERK